MAKLKPINFMNVSKDKGVYDMLVHAVVANFEYTQTKGLCAELGYYLPLDQFNAFSIMLGVQAELHIGERREELEV